MTNREEGDSCQSRLAALLAVHLVSQVLDEAYVIANAATESGIGLSNSQPWRYLEMLKNLRSGKLGNVVETIVSDTVSKGDSIDEINSKTNDITINVVATSTPQKMPDEVGKLVFNSNLIGQGDEEIISDMRQAELNNSTSMFINHLFDMSDVERVTICDDTEITTQCAEELSNILTLRDMIKAMTTVMEYVDNSASAVNATSVMSQHVSEDGEKENEGDMARYENTFLTLNRDYDQCSEEDVEPDLEDPKEMQEVELEVAHDTDDKVITNEPVQPKDNELTAVSAVSASSRKSSLVQRCRNHGARLLSCLRGWWRRKTPGKRKEARVPGSLRGLCPLSPDARRRAASLLNQSRLGSPDQPRHVVWKFNTVSEALVNSSRWKNYTFDANIKERGELVI